MPVPCSRAACEFWSSSSTAPPPRAPGRDHRPTPSERVTPQARSLLMNLQDHADGLQFSVRDRDAKFAAAFDAVVTAANVRIINTRAGNPGGRDRGMAIASARRERLDQMLIIGERHLRLVLNEYADHYFSDCRGRNSGSDLGFHVTCMFATAKSEDQRGGRSQPGSVGPPSLVKGERSGRRGHERLISPGRSQKAPRRTWRTLAGPVGKHYDNHRPHRALRHDPPADRAQPPVEVTGIRVPRRDQLGGLSREYAHAA